MRPIEWDTETLLLPLEDLWKRNGRGGLLLLYRKYGVEEGILRKNGHATIKDALLMIQFEHRNPDGLSNSASEGRFVIGEGQNGCFERQEPRELYECVSIVNNYL